MKHLTQRLFSVVDRYCTDERGVALAVAAISMMALTSAVALAVDVGMMTVARTEAQSVADGAAMAGAAVLIPSPQNDEWARDQAIAFAGMNSIRGQRTEVLEEDVVVNLGARTVAVQVQRTEARGNPIGTFFARVFGVTTVNITAYAKARASFAGGIDCPLPLAVPDQWNEVGGDPDEFNPEAGDTYVPWMDTSTDPPTYNHEGYTGYSDHDIGDQIALTANQGGGIMHPGWYNAWRPPGQSGADDFRENIRECVDPTISYYIGQTVYTEQGNMNGPTGTGFRDLIDSDPEAVWNDNEGMQCVTDAAYQSRINEPEHCRTSTRIRPIPMFDPRYPPEGGHSPFTLTNFAGVFVEEIQGGGNNAEFIARWIGYRGVSPASDQSGAAGPQFKVLQLIE